MKPDKIKKRIIFMGTPEFAVPSLEALINAEDIEVVAIITQPDKAVGRKQIMTAPPIKLIAEKYGIKIYQPEKISHDETLLKELIELVPDFLITVAYGQILKQNILDIAPVINLHASLLPEFRGPAPINWMIIHGDTQVGLTTMLTDIGVDTGNMLLKYTTELGKNENSEELSIRLSENGAELLLKTLREFGTTQSIKQAPIDSSRQLAPFMDKNLGKIEFATKNLNLNSANPKQKEFRLEHINSASNIHNLVRGTYPWPGSYFMDGQQKVIILETKVSEANSTGSNPGVILSIDKTHGSFTVQCQQGSIEILKVKPEGKNEMKALDWLNGKRLQVGDKI